MCHRLCPHLLIYQQTEQDTNYAAASQSNSHPVPDITAHHPVNTHDPDDLDEAVNDLIRNERPQSPVAPQSMTSQTPPPAALAGSGRDQELPDYESSPDVEAPSKTSETWTPASPRKPSSYDPNVIPNPGQKRKREYDTSPHGTRQTVNPRSIGRKSQVNSVPESTFYKKLKEGKLAEPNAGGQIP